MTDRMDPLAVDRQFFDSLIQADQHGLDRVLAEDFILIDVMGGSEITKPSWLAALGSGQVIFEGIEPADNLARLYPGTAVVTGRTRIRGRLGGAPFEVASRYVHVYVMQQGSWRMVSAQGTPIAEEPAA
jgi:ketosteroid isomerase-like protein